MENNEERKSVTFCVNIALWRKLKAMAALGGWKVGEMLERAIEQEIKSVEEQEGENGR